MFYPITKINIDGAAMLDIGCAIARPDKYFETVCGQIFLFEIEGTISKNQLNHINACLQAIGHSFDEALYEAAKIDMSYDKACDPSWSIFHTEDEMLKLSYEMYLLEFKVICDECNINIGNYS